MSLRTRLLLGMVTVAIVLVVAAMVITRVTEQNLLEQVDKELTDVQLGDLFRRGPPGEPSLSTFYVTGVTDDGEVVTLIAPTFGEDPPRPDLSEDVVDEHSDGDPFTVGSDGSNGRYRSVVLHFEQLGEAETTSGVPLRGDVVVSLPLDDVDAAVDRLIAVEIVATLAVLTVLGLVTYWVLRLGVRPLKTMTATATAIADGDLSHRVPDVAPGTEAGELGTALNRMLGRIQEAFSRRDQTEAQLRQFVGDASHELRTPVTTIRGYAELYRAGGLADPDELGEAMRRTELEAERMGRLVEDLLALARLDQDRPLDRSPVDLTAVAADAARDAKAVEPDRPVQAHADTPVTVVGDDARIRQVVANLVGNALVHTPRGTPIELRVGQGDGHGVLEVIDHGPGMAPDVAARVFERFYRADPSRSRHRGGSGLGLAIVDATVAAHGGSVSLHTVPGEGTTVRVELPLR